MTPPTDGSRGRGELRSVQYLRAVAALMVVAYHLKPRLARMGYAGGWPEWLSCGVDIFFVISGLIMWLTTSERATTPADFLRRRLLRIVPLYWAVTALMVAMLVLAPSLVVGGRLDLPHALASFLFLPWPHPVTGALEPVLPPGWTLNYEMAFYVLFALALLAPRMWRVEIVVAALGLLVIGGVLLGATGIAGFYTSSLILEFGFGVVLGATISRGWRVGPFAAAALVAAGTVGLVATWPLVEAGVPRALASGVCATAIVAGAVWLEAAGRLVRSRLWRLLGDASYALYLTHGLALSAVATAWVRLGLHGPASLVLFALVAVAAATLAGTAIHLGVERPLQRLLRPRRHAATLAVA